MTTQSEKIPELINHVNSQPRTSRTTCTECHLATDPGRSDKAKLGPTMGKSHKRPLNHPFPNLNEWEKSYTNNKQFTYK